MSLKRIAILVAKALAIIALTMACAMLMTKVAPTEETGFKALRYMVLPFYAGLLSCLFYLAIAVFAPKYEKPAFFVALVSGIIYTIALFVL